MQGEQNQFVKRQISDFECSKISKRLTLRYVSLNWNIKLKSVSYGNYFVPYVMAMYLVEVNFNWKMIVRPFLFRGKEHNFLFSWKKLNINHHIHIPQWSNFSSKVLHKNSHTLFQKILWNKKRAGISKIILPFIIPFFLSCLKQE